MDFKFELGKLEDVDELEQLYNDLNDHLAMGVNHPGWIKGVYPIRQQAEEGVEKGILYVARQAGKIAGTIVLDHTPEHGYESATWAFETDYSDVIVLRTFAVHPAYLRCGTGNALMEFAIGEASRLGMKGIRLDVNDRNTPAIRLYEKHGFRYVDTVDLGLGEYGLKWFKLYEIEL